jgi:sugar/nucleoside kinase (ribokinase family)
VAEIARLGSAEAIMTVPDGCYGHVLVDGVPSLYRVRVEPLEARSPIGSGDAFLAGYVAARYSGRDPVECLRYGVACGAESTQHIGAGILEPAKVERVLEGVRAERLAMPAPVS